MELTAMSKYILDKYQVRKTRKQKEKFRELLCKDLKEAGYEPKVEKESNIVKCHNVVVGDPQKAKVLVTAHYDTCAVLPFPNLITPRNMFWYMLYQIGIVLLMGILMIAVTIVSERILQDDGIISIWIGMLSMFVFLWLLMFGKANQHTANDNTSGVISVLEAAHRIPAEMRDKVCFVFFDNEELGVLGSGAFAASHKDAKNKVLVLNCDCVSDGDYIQLFPSKAVKKNEQMSQLIENALQNSGKKETEYVKTFGFYPSDNMSFRYGVGICALKKGAVGFYMDRIHTNKDTIFEEENIEQVVRFLCRMIESA